MSGAHARLALPSERSVFVEMWGEFLREQREGGSSLHDDDFNLKIFRDYFDAYAKGELRGVTAFWQPTPADGPAGLIMGGECYGEPLWHDDFSDLANMWGVYVRPEYRQDGAALDLSGFAVPLLKEMGFRGAFTTVRVDNKLGLAMRESLEKMATITPLTMSYAGVWEEK